MFQTRWLSEFHLHCGAFNRDVIGEGQCVTYLISVVQDRNSSNTTRDSSKRQDSGLQPCGRYWLVGLGEAAFSRVGEL